jgi:tetratricopeptide (TPR) repeat protein
MAPRGVSDETLLSGRYRIVRRLGSGGMASVLLAVDERLGREVAIKRLPTGSPEEALRRFQREARLGASLNHPGIVSIYDSIAGDDAVLIVMEYVDGSSLKELIAEGPLAPDEALAILRQIAAALDHSHANGVIHRDVKPSNVLLRKDGTAKLADLGIATAVGSSQITASGSVVGTLAYIAPERLEAEGDTPAADVYSLAAVAYEALSGARAQKGRTPLEVVESAATGPAPDLRHDLPQAPLQAAAVLREGLSPSPRRRPQSAGELVADLERAYRKADTETATAPAAAMPSAADRREPEPGAPLTAETLGPPPTPAGPPSGRERSRWLAAVALAACAAGVGAVLAIALSGGDDKPRRGAAQQASANAPPPSTTTATEISTVQSPPPPTSDDAAASAPSGSGAALNDQGYALIQQGRYEEAVPVLQQAVDSFPEGTTDLNYAYALYNLGHALRLAGRPDEAIPVLEQRLQIPNQTSVVQRELELAQAEAG